MKTQGQLYREECAFRDAITKLYDPRYDMDGQSPAFNLIAHALGQAVVGLHIYKHLENKNLQVKS